MILPSSELLLSFSTRPIVLLPKNHTRRKLPFQFTILFRPMLPPQKTAPPIALVLCYYSYIQLSLLYLPRLNVPHQITDQCSRLNPALPPHHINCSNCLNVSSRSIVQPSVLILHRYLTPSHGFLRFPWSSTMPRRLVRHVLASLSFPLPVFRTSHLACSKLMNKSCFSLQNHVYFNDAFS